MPFKRFTFFLLLLFTVGLLQAQAPFGDYFFENLAGGPMPPATPFRNIKTIAFFSANQALSVEVNVPGTTNVPSGNNFVRYIVPFSGNNLQSTSLTFQPGTDSTYGTIVDLVHIRDTFFAALAVTNPINYYNSNVGTNINSNSTNSTVLLLRYNRTVSSISVVSRYTPALVYQPTGDGWLPNFTNLNVMGDTVAFGYSLAVGGNFNGIRQHSIQCFILGSNGQFTSTTPTVLYNFGNPSNLGNGVLSHIALANRSTGYYGYFVFSPSQPLGPGQIPTNRIDWVDNVDGYDPQISTTLSVRDIKFDGVNAAVLTLPSEIYMIKGFKGTQATILTGTPQGNNSDDKLTKIALRGTTVAAVGNGGMFIDPNFTVAGDSTYNSNFDHTPIANGSPIMSDVEFGKGIDYLIFTVGEAQAASAFTKCPTNHFSVTTSGLDVVVTLNTPGANAQTVQITLVDCATKALVAGPVSLSNNPTRLTAPSAGDYIVYVVFAQSCLDSSACLTLSATNPCPAQVSITANGASLSVPAAGAAFPNATYTWQDCSNNSTVSTGSNTFTATATGQYRCVIVYNATCTTTTDCENATVIPTSVDPNLQSAFSLYPNPVADVLHLSFSTPAERSLTLVNTRGEVVRSLNLPAHLTHEVNVADLPAGLYLARVGAHTVRFVRQ